MNDTFSLKYYWGMIITGQNKKRCMYVKTVVGVINECAGFCNLIPMVLYDKGWLSLQKEMHNILYL